MKDGSGGYIMKEFAGLRAKTQSYSKAQGSNMFVINSNWKINTVQRQLNLKINKTIKENWCRHYSRTFRSEKQNVFTEEIAVFTED